MKLILIGMIIGIGKIIPGVSGAMLAISLGVYEKAISILNNFFDNIKENTKFLLLLGIGILSSIVFGSKIIIYLLNNYYFITMMFFIGLIISGLIDYKKQVRFTFKNNILMILVLLLFILISLVDNNHIYELTGNISDIFIFFLGGIIEIFSSLVPGISGTALLMILGIYEDTLVLFSSVYDINYVIENVKLYLSYGVGMGVSFIFVIFGINYLFKHHRSLIECLIFSFSLSSIYLLFKMINFGDVYLYEYFFGIISLILGIYIGNKGLEK